MSSFSSVQQSEPSSQNLDVSDVIGPLSPLREGDGAPGIHPNLRLHNNRYVIYEHDKDEIFMRWWKETEWRFDPGSDHHRYPHWNSTTRTSEAWKGYTQVADRRDGHPKLLCGYCDNIIEHPNNKNGGSSGMRQHTNSNNCRDKARAYGRCRVRVGMQNQTTLKVRIRLPLYNYYEIARLTFSSSEKDDR